tara:strand:- start:15800 stop:17419 length:1620 start_codon:yes stop_codon:yes gene_type:complete
MKVNHKNNQFIINQFNSHNKQIFPETNKKKKRRKIFLIEFNGWPVIHIIFSYLVNYFKVKKNCKIIAYECFDLLNRENPKWYKKYLWTIGSNLNFKTFKIFKSFGTDTFLKPKYTNEISFEAEKITNNFILTKPNLRDLENLKVYDIWIGDLIYDSYLKKYSSVTINLNSSNFINYFKDTIKLFLFWKNFFKENDVEAICVCHAVYLTGIPLRIAQSKKLNCFSISNCNLVNLTNSISFKKKTNGSDIHFKFYDKIFNNIPKKFQKKFLIKGKKILNDYTSGKKKYYYLKKATFKKKVKIHKLKSSSKIKVIIFSHDFIDSPHIHGNHFFSDFKQWLLFLSKIIKQTDYDWYIKLHPASSNITKKEIKNFVKNNHKLKLINKDFPNNYLKQIGIDYVLTVYGTVASEMPIHNIKVINASKNNPHFDYNFCINPKNLDEYKKTLLNLKKRKKKVNFNKLYSYHFMKYMTHKQNIFFRRPEKYFSFVNNKPLQYTNKIYDYWLKDFNSKIHNYIIQNLEEFIISKNYFYFDTDKTKLNSLK